MAKAKRIRTITEEPILHLQAPSSSSFTIGHPGTNYKDCDWCFQFGDDEPFVFATTKPFYEGDTAKITFTLTNQTNTNIVFKDTKTGKQFKLFAREKQS